MYTTIVTIGRNVTNREGDQHPMPEQDWADFEDYVHSILTDAAQWQESAGWDTYLTVFRGTGVWQGVSEDSISFQLLHDVEFEPGDYELIRNRLKDAARLWNQETIALIPAARADLVPSNAGL